MADSVDQPQLPLATLLLYASTSPSLPHHRYANHDHTFTGLALSYVASSPLRFFSRCAHHLILQYIGPLLAWMLFGVSIVQLCMSPLLSTVLLASHTIA